MYNISLHNNAFHIYLVGYGVFRFVIEYDRGDDRGILLQSILSPSQCISLIMVLLGIFLVYLKKKNTSTLD